MRSIRHLVAITAVFLLMTGVPAKAAENLTVTADPASRQELTTRPGWVVLAFNEKIQGDDAKLAVTDASGAVVTTNVLTVKDMSMYIQLIPELPKGTYTVNYQVRTLSGTLAGGAYQFAYGNGTWTDLPDSSWVGEANQPSSNATTDEYGQPTAAPNTSDSASPEETPSESGSATPASSAAPATASATPTPAASEEEPAQGAPLGWIAAGIGLIAAAVVGTVLVLRRRAASAPRYALPAEAADGNSAGPAASAEEGPTDPEA